MSDETPYWLLSDAALWIAFGIEPEGEEHALYRASGSHFVANERPDLVNLPRYGDLRPSYFTPEQTQYASIPEDPRWKQQRRIEEGLPPIESVEKTVSRSLQKAVESHQKDSPQSNPFTSLVSINGVTRASDIPKFDLADVGTARRFEGEKIAWTRAYRNALGTAERKLKFMLKSGLLRSEGFRSRIEISSDMPSNVDTALDDYALTNSHNFPKNADQRPRKIIDLDWRAGDCNFDRSALLVGETLYQAVRVYKAELQNARQENINQPSLSRSNNVGRRVKSSPALYLIADQVVSDLGITTKQTALVAEICERMQEQHGETVGHSTLSRYLRKWRKLGAFEFEDSPSEAD